MRPAGIIVAGVLGVYLIYSGIAPNLLKLITQAVGTPLPGSTSPNVSTGPIPAGGTVT